MSTKMSVVETMQAEIAKCRESEMAACGVISTDLSEGDCEAVVDAVQRAHGRMPTRAEWTDATGLGWVGCAHYEG